MKLSILIAIVFVFTAAISFGQKNYSYLDNDKGTSIEPILAAAKPLVEEIEGKDFEIARMEYDLIFDKKSTFRTLYEGWTHGIAAFGDYRIKDVDITVYKERGNDKKLKRMLKMMMWLQFQ